MIKNKICKVLACLVVALMIFTTVGQTAVYAAKKTESKTFVLSNKRKVKNNNGEYIDKGEYKLNTGSDYPIFQIISKNGTEITGTNYYCLKAKLGDTWGDPNNSVGFDVTANTSYDLVEDKTEIGALSNEKYANIVTNNYGPVMWILDNMYTENGLTTTQLLNNAGIVYGANPEYPTLTNWHYDSDELVWQYGFAGYTVDGEDIVLDVADIQAIQQAAIWHFTNSGDSEFDFNIPEGASNAGYQFKIDETNATKKAMKQEQMAILYNYFVNNAKTKTDYTGNTKGTLELKYTTSKKIEKDGDNYRIGPLKATTTGIVTDLNVQITPATGAKITNASGEEKTFKANEEFYVTIPTSSVTSDVKINVTGKTMVTEKKLWLRIDDNKTEQPIVEPIRTEIPLSSQQTATPGKQFDLALRKTIVKIVDSKGTTKSILNEDGKDATRTVTVDPTSIPDTAKYKHRKDPVVITTGDVVTYRIAIYNEGDIDGYASKIVDQLPTGLESVLKKDGTVTSHNGNVYTVTEYDSTTNKLVLSVDKTKTITSIDAFNGTTVKNDYIEIDCKVIGTAKTDGTTKQYLTNIAYIAEEYDKDGNQVTADRDGNESKPTTSPNKTADQLNNSNADNYKGNTSNKSVYSDTNNTEYYKGEEDDDDFEKLVILPKQFDLALRKFITKINDKNITDREPNITGSEVEKLINNNATFDNGTTASKKHSKDKLKVAVGDTVIYTIRIYNEGEIDGYASEVTDYLPEGLSLKENSTINDTYGWTKGTGNAIKTTYLSDKLITAMNSTSTSISYKDLQVECVVNSKATANNLKNIAEITEDKDKDGNDVEDRDSTPDNVNKDNYKPTNPEDGRGEQDDDDFEDLELAKLDLALRKFIAKISSDGNFENTSTTTTYNREPQVDSSELKAGTAETAIYNHSKKPIVLNAGDYVLYTIRVYNEGDIDGYASQIVDYLPENLDFVESTDTYINSINEKWSYDSKTRKVTTKNDSLNATTKLAAFDAQNDNGSGSGLSYVDMQIICRVNKKATSNKKLTNIAEISEYKNQNGDVIPTDRDSDSNNLKYPDEPSTYKDNEINKDYVPGQQDDDDFEKVIVKDFDLALRKFITEIDTVNAKQNKTTTETNFGREPKLSYENGKITYTHPKDVIRTTVDSVVTYTLRVFNEGDIAGYAEEISDDMPEYLEFLPEHATNREYKWVMYDKDGKSTTKVDEAVKIKTDYTSKANGELLMKNNTKLTENPNLLNAFDKEKGITDTNPDYVDVKVAFKVKDPNSNKTVIVNKAQISEDADENGNPVEDIDSIPDKWNDGEDDQDYENVAVDYFDLSLLKYVTKAIVTENGKTKTTKTGNNGSKNDITPKVEIYRKRINKTIVKFEFTIKITNEGDIAGYAKEITDYVPKGLKFYKEDNKGWKDEGNNVISTKLLKDTLLQPGQSATVKVVLRWINGENNLGLKTNVAEISEDYNEKGVPDRDSVPDNKKKGEDDIDDAPVLLTISTGMLENTIQIATGALVVLVILGTGLIVIKKYVI